MAGLGRREWFAIIVLVIAVGIAAMFVNTGVGSPEFPEEEPEPTPTATAIPPDKEASEARPLPGTPSWVYTFTDLRDEPGVVRDRSEGDRLNFVWEGAPFPEYADGKWMFAAEWAFEAPAGLYAIELAFQGDLRVLVNGMEIIHSAGGMDGTTTRAVFEHKGSVSTLRIELVDSQGSARLEWLSLRD